MRLFTALDPSPAVQDCLGRLLDHLRPTASLRWTRPEGLHLTLKFIGERPEAQLPALREALATVPFTPIEVRVAGVGFFPNANAPRVFWVGIQASAELAALAAAIDRRLEPLGIARETRSYSPHLTLARLPDRTPLQALHQALATLGPADCGVFTAGCFYLYESRPAPGGSRYTRLGEFPCSR